MPNETEDYNNFVRANLPAGMTYSADRYRYNNHSFYVFELAAWYYYYLLRVNSPSNLFSAGEVGVWYDPSDLTTLFQDSAGTTPVTAAGQPVGLMLDKSKGSSFGADIAVNGNFSGGSTNWTLGSGVTISGGVASFAAGSGYLSQSVPTQAGRAYRVTATATNLIFCGAWDTVNQSGSLQLLSGGSSATVRSGTFSYIFVAVDANSYVDFTASGAGATTLDNVSVIPLPLGNHATQSTSAQRPTYQIDANGRPCLSFDGVDDGMATSAIDFSATDAVTVFTGLRKLSDATRGVLVELGNNPGVATFQLNAPTDSLSGYSMRSTGSLSSASSIGGFLAPDTAVITMQGKISLDTAILRRNGVEVATSASDQGTGNYSNAILYIGRRGGSNLPLNGNIYSLIVRGVGSTTGQITSTETWVNAKTGAY